MEGITQLDQVSTTTRCAGRLPQLMIVPERHFTPLLQIRPKVAKVLLAAAAYERLASMTPQDLRELTRMRGEGPLPEIGSVPIS